MAEKLNILSERVDDIPLILSELERMGVCQLLDARFPTHGNWDGLSLGCVGSVWLSHILSEADHRLNHVQPWAEHRLETLSRCIGVPVRGLDFSDDRLGLILDRLSEDDPWDDFECQLSQSLLRVYDLSGKVVRLDTTSASGYWQVSEEGLFQLGHSKDHRPDLPQVKVMLSTLDPMGMALCMEVVSGEQADDPLYLPAIDKVRRIFQTNGLLYVGDAKMAAQKTRATIVINEDFYLCPLPELQMSKEALDAYLEPVWAGEQYLTALYWEDEITDGEARLTEVGRESPGEKIAEGFDIRHPMRVEIDEKTVTWSERLLIVRSLKLAQNAKVNLDKRLQKAQEQLLQFNERQQGRKRYRSREELQPLAEKILQKNQVKELLSVAYQENGSQRLLRKYKDKAERFSDEREVIITVRVDDTAYQQTIRRFGWRVFATNVAEGNLPLSKAILAYRHEFLVEHNFSRLKGKPLSLRPMYLQTEKRIVGLIRLLSIALRVLVLIEYQLRQQLAKQQTVLTGLYQGNPKRATAHPTTEQVLKAFRYITLTIIHQQNQTLCHLTELNELQIRILELLNFSVNIYTRLAAEFQKPG
jgi:transposase